MRALAYVRISELSDATTSPERQRTECKTWIERHDGELVDIIEDLDISGFHTGMDRPGLSEALSRIEAKEADTLVIYKIDRLARSIVTFHQVLDRVEAVDGRLVSVSEALDFGTPAGRLVASVLASFAEFESQTISSRVKAAQNHLADIGKWRGGRRPFGWNPEPSPDGKGFVLVQNDDEAAVVLEVVDRLLGGESLTAVAGDLNKRGITTVKGSQWQHTTLKRVLMSDPVHRLVGDQRWIELQKAIPDRRAAAARLEERGLLNGLCVCGRCGHPMQETIKGKHRLYVCNTGSPGIGYCSVSVAAARAEEAAVEKVMAVIGGLEVEEPAGELVDLYAEKRAAINGSIEALEEDRYLRGMFRSDDELERYTALHARLTADLAALPAPHYEETGLNVPTGQIFEQVWEEADLDERRRWLELMLREVEIRPASSTAWNPERVGISFK